MGHHPRVQPKKHLGQHFLTDRGIARRIVDSLRASEGQAVLEVGPGMGVLTGMLWEQYGDRLHAAEVDRESVDYLKRSLPQLGDRLHQADFLHLDLARITPGSLAVIGNFPYNISSQIFFRILDSRAQIAQAVGMVQQEVARRICEGPGSRTHGILSVLLQAYYHIEYLFTVSEGVFHPPPKVKSAVIRLIRNHTQHLDCNEELFRVVVKTGFNQRRKTLRNSLRGLAQTGGSSYPLLDLRPEQLGVERFVELTRWVEDHRHSP